MAPKKKKPASNPARGFATVSLPSKAKADDRASESEIVPAEAGNIESDSHESRVAVNMTQPLQDASSFQDMTADQLESHLEDAELQNIVEKSAERSKQIAARQIARLEAERRTLRGQAMPLETDDWLTEGIVEEIFNLNQSSEGENERPLHLPQHDKEMQQDDLLVKLWTLQQVLKLLQLPHEERVLKHVVSLTNDFMLSSKDYIWGLEESLDWLALHASLEELPSYQPGIPSSRPFQSEYSAPPSSSEGSRATSPTRKAKYGSRIPVIESTSTITPVSTNANRVGHSDTQLASSLNTDDSTDDDNDPDGLVSRYIDTKLQLLKLEPEFRYDESPTTDTKHEKGLKPSQVSRLRQRVEAIERDILFDHEKANAQLNETLNQFRADVSRRRAERGATKSFAKDNPRAASPQATTGGPEAALDPAEAEGEVDGLFGDMFTPAETISPKHEQNAQNEDDGSMLLVDFGKWAGISPRKVLEYTCKTR
jgi:ATP-dependent RNA helicase DHX29